MKRGKKRPKGRSGGRGGASGYDFQDLYVALQLAHLLVQSRSNAPVEVGWEKKAFDTGAGEKPLPLVLEDVVLVLKSGKRIHVEVKETAPSGKWSIQRFCSSGLAGQFWQAWKTTPQRERGNVAFRLASRADLSQVNLLLDLARRSRTPAELKSEEGASAAQRDLARLARSLAVQESDPELLTFLKSLEGKQLPDPEELEGLIADALAAFGSKASETANHLIRLVARSKPVGATARSSYTRESLASVLSESGADEESLISIGALQADTSRVASDWSRYRRSLVRELRSMRVYGLRVQKAVNADLLTLFVPLRFSRIGSREAEEREAERPPRRRSFLERLLEEQQSFDEAESAESRHEYLPLGEVLKTERRFALVAGPGTGKTTVLKWLTIVSALPGEAGRKLRLRYGLPRKPLTPIYVRFRQLADRVLQRGLQGVRWRAGLVSDFLAAQFEAGLLGTAPSRQEAVAIAQTALQSEETFLLLDGLDEISDESTRTNLFMAVDDLMQTYDKPRFALSWRPYALALDQIPSDIPLFGPQFFNSAELRTFARNWYRSIRPKLGKEAMSAEDSESRAEDLARAAINVCELAECPLLYSILALIHFNKKGLPVDRTSLYDQATLAMLGHWERDPSGRGLGRDSFPGWCSELPCNEGEIRTVVERLAYRIQCREGGNEFSTDSAVEALAEGLGTDLCMDKQAASHAGLLLQLLIERSGLILEKSPGVLAFVHRSFQEYLAARWFAARGSPGSEELKSLASDEMHSEVVQFCVAVMAADSDEAERTRIGTLLGEIGSISPAVAAACLVETPDLELSEETAKDLGRAVWTECSSMFRRHYPPQATSRLVWACLNRTSDPDRLLLEFLSDEGSDMKMRHGAMESSMAVLFSRPANLPLSDSLRWVLKRMLRVKEGWELIQAQRGLASLLLVENGEESATASLLPILRLLGEQFWWHRRVAHAESPGNRAERIIQDLLEDPNMRDRALGALRSALDTVSASGDWRKRAAQFLVLEGDPFTGTTAEALVEIRTYDKEDQQKAADFIQEHARGESEQQLIATAIQRKLEDATEHTRKAYYALARDSGIHLSGLPLPAADFQNESERVAQICSLLSEGSTKAETLEAVADELWEENAEIAWQAALALLQTKRFETPGLPQALVRCGLKTDERRSRTFRELTRLHSMPPVSLSVRSALLEGLRSESGSVAAASAQLLLDFASARVKKRGSRSSNGFSRKRHPCSNQCASNSFEH